MREESFANSVADHGYVAAVEVLGIGEEAALGECGINQAQMFGGDAYEKGINHVLAFVPGGDRRQAEVSHFPKEFRRDRFGGGALLLDGHGIFIAQRFAQPLVARQPVRSAEL